MALFLYKAVSATGDIIEGELEAVDQKEVIEWLHTLGHTPIRADEITRAIDRRALSPLFWLGRRDRISRRDITEFTRQLATLLGAGLELDRALDVMIDVSDKEAMRRMLANLQDHIRGGAALSDAMVTQGSVFSSLYLNLVRAGEAGGALDPTLQRLANYLERAAELRETVKSALVYPAVLITVAALSVVVLLTVVLPEFSQLFEDMGATLPLATQIVMALGEFLKGYGWVIVVLAVILIASLRRQLTDPDRRYRWDSTLLKIPLVSELIVKLEVARFSQTLGALLTNGVPLLGALKIVKETLNNQVLAENLDQVSESLKRGGGLAQPLAEAQLFPRHAIHLLRVGEETGNLDDMLLKIADVYDKEVQLTIKRLLALLEPALILGLGAIVAAIILSILLAILGINDLPI